MATVGTIRGPLEAMRAALITKTVRRNNEEPRQFIAMADDRPEWVRDAVYAAHGEHLPDDWTFATISEIVDALHEAEDDAEAFEVVEAIEPEIYTHELTGWLHSRNDRGAYCNDAIEEYGLDRLDIITLLQMGQQRERFEIAGAILLALEEVALLGTTADA